jgi:hypothetical protein
MFKTITPKDIEYKDDKIQHITGLDFSKGKIILKRPLCSTIGSSTSIETPEITPENNSKNLSENWEKYLTILRTQL